VRPVGALRSTPFSKISQKIFAAGYNFPENPVIRKVFRGQYFSANPRQTPKSQTSRFGIWQKKVKVSKVLGPAAESWLLHYGNLFAIIEKIWRGRVKAMREATAACISFGFLAVAVLFACFALGLFDGDGVSRVRDKDYDEFTFTGDLRNGRFTGYGSMHFQDGELYIGNFAVGRFNGEGTLYCSVNNWNFNGVFTEGRVSSGEFQRDEGEKVEYERGETADTLIGAAWNYEGVLSELGQNGPGVFTFPDGSVYTGGFSHGLAEGEGRYADALGRTVYTGVFLGGKFDGQGKYYSLEGWSYEGGFKEGLFDGEGTLITETETIRGIWEKGVQITRHE
jgi:hypothetical protein